MSDQQDSATNETILAFAYFRQVYPNRVEIGPDGETYEVPLTDRPFCDAALHLALSKDGRRWTPLNDNRPTLPDTDGGSRFIRDPFIARGPDGFFHLIGTGGKSRRGCVYQRSRDLITWEEARTLPLMETVPRAVNVWAPEWRFDHGRGQYFVYWSSSFGRRGWDDSRIWCAWTGDWQTFSPPRLLLDPGYTVIDATIVPAGGQYHLFFKDERFGHAHGEHRFIKRAVAPSLEGPYDIHGADPITPQLTEGPAVYADPVVEGWLLAFDFCMANGYGLYRSPDLLDWTPDESAAFPPDARHGSVFPITMREREALLATFGGAARPSDMPS
jgi:hypothetical protein